RARARACPRRCETGSPVAKAVADAANGEDVLRFGRVQLELLPQVPHVNVDRPRFAVVSRPPERLEEHATAVDPAWMARQRAEQLEFDVRQADGVVPDLDRAPAQVDPQSVGGDHLALAARPGRRGTPQESPDPERNSRIEKG